MRILVADDERDLNALIAQKLRKEHYSVDCCHDGEEALEYLRMADYDAVVLDIMMPKMDGFEVLAFIKKKKLECQPCGYYDLCGQFSCEYKTGI